MSYDLLSGNEAVHSGWISARNTIESFKGVEALMMRRMEEEASRIFLACGLSSAYFYPQLLLFSLLFQYFL